MRGAADGRQVHIIPALRLDGVVLIPALRLYGVVRHRGRPAAAADGREAKLVTAARVARFAPVGRR